jgi:hypothetical protein
MSRQSRDVRAPDGSILDGFDYDLQVWVVGGIVQTCGHPERMRPADGRGCCNAWRYGGEPVATIPGHESR